MKILTLLMLVFIFVSCRSERGAGPVEIHYSEDVCDKCKMIISEKEYSAQYVLLDGDARKFDDIGCMVEYLKENEREVSSILAVYVRDHVTGEWIDGKAAVYFRGETIRTPMGYGIAAFSSEESLRRFSSYVRGEELGGFRELTEAGASDAESIDQMNR